MFVRPTLFPPVLIRAMRRARVGVGIMTQEKESRLGGAGSVVWTGLLRRRDGGDGLQAEGNDLGTDHFARDDQFDAAVLLATIGGIV
jgi:hypothetical protein